MSFGWSRRSGLNQPSGVPLHARPVLVVVRFDKKRLP
jgi:hypothetical protein